MRDVAHEHHAGYCWAGKARAAMWARGRRANEERTAGGGDRGRGEKRGSISFGADASQAVNLPRSETCWILVYFREHAPATTQVEIQV